MNYIGTVDPEIGIVGVAGLYMGAAHHYNLSSVMANEPPTLYRWSAKALAQMKREEAYAAVAFQEFVIHFLVEHLP